LCSKYEEIKNEIAETIINGTNNTYPPVISAIKNTAVKGILMTPDRTPAIPTTVKLIAFRSIMPVLFIVIDIKYPRNPPIKSEGAKIPPLPPAEIVIPVAYILTNSNVKIIIGVRVFPIEKTL